MPSVPLPENPSIDHLKSQAKLVQQLVRAGDEGAYAMVREFHPRLADVAKGGPELQNFRRSDAQVVVARLYGFPSWARLRRELELIEAHTAVDPADVDPTPGTDDVDRFVSLACVTYNPVEVMARLQAGRQMLDADPGLAGRSPAAMAATGDRAGLELALAENRSLANQVLKPHRWPPLLYVTYGRLVPNGGNHSPVATARLLLEHGADPNAGFLWHGLVPPFTAVTGALGRGEGDQPRHPDWHELTRLLLEAGADPNDGQGLYNNGLAGTAHDDPTHLKLLTEFGLGRPQDGPWYRRFGDRLTPPGELLYDELEVAAIRSLPNRMRFLVGLGLDLGRPVGRSGKRPLDLATERDHEEVATMLRTAGA